MNDRICENSMAIAMAEQAKRAVIKNKPRRKNRAPKQYGKGK